MKSYTVEEIKVKITSDQAWTERALTALYRHQTQDEKRADQTRHTNYRGFNRPDAKRLSTYARRVNYRGHLTEMELLYTQRRIGKYARQLWQIVEDGKATIDRVEIKEYNVEASTIGLSPGEWPSSVVFGNEVIRRTGIRRDEEYEVMFAVYESPTSKLRVYND